MDEKKFMIYGITYSDSNMTRSAELCKNSMLRNGIDAAMIFGTGDIAKTFVNMNKDIFDQHRGCGYWLWKPAIICAVLISLKDNDILIYSDAGVEFIAPVNPIIEAMNQDVFLFTNGFKQAEWCKMDVMEAICTGYGIRLRGNENTYIKDETQVQASVIFIRVNQTTRNFIKEWLLWCQMPGFIDDSPSKLPNFPTFAEHRHDQALLTCMQIKYGYKLHWWPDGPWANERHRWPDDKYPVMFLHHRKRDPGKGGGNPTW